MKSAEFGGFPVRRSSQGSVSSESNSSVLMRRISQRSIEKENVFGAWTSQSPTNENGDDDSNSTGPASSTGPPASKTSTWSRDQDNGRGSIASFASSLRIYQDVEDVSIDGTQSKDEQEECDIVSYNKSGSDASLPPRVTRNKDPTQSGKEPPPPLSKGLNNTSSSVPDSGDEAIISESEHKESKFIRSEVMPSPTEALSTPLEAPDAHWDANFNHPSTLLPRSSQPKPTLPEAGYFSALPPRRASVSTTIPATAPATFEGGLPSPAPPQPRRVEDVPEASQRMAAEGEGLSSAVITNTNWAETSSLAGSTSSGFTAAVPSHAQLRNTMQRRFSTVDMASLSIRMQLNPGDGTSSTSSTTVEGVRPAGGGGGAGRNTQRRHSTIMNVVHQPQSHAHPISHPSFSAKAPRRDSSGEYRRRRHSLGEVPSHERKNNTSAPSTAILPSASLNPAVVPSSSPVISPSRSGASSPSPVAGSSVPFSTLMPLHAGTVGRAQLHFQSHKQKERQWLKHQGQGGGGETRGRDSRRGSDPQFLASTVTSSEKEKLKFKSEQVRADEKQGVDQEAHDERLKAVVSQIAQEMKELEQLTFEVSNDAARAQAESEGRIFDMNESSYGLRAGLAAGRLEPSRYQRQKAQNASRGNPDFAAHTRTKQESRRIPSPPHQPRAPHESQSKRARARQPQRPVIFSADELTGAGVPSHRSLYSSNQKNRKPRFGRVETPPFHSGAPSPMKPPTASGEQSRPGATSVYSGVREGPPVLPSSPSRLGGEGGGGGHSPMTPSNIVSDAAAGGGGHQHLSLPGVAGSQQLGSTEKQRGVGSGVQGQGRARSQIRGRGPTAVLQESELLTKKLTPGRDGEWDREDFDFSHSLEHMGSPSPKYSRLGLSAASAGRGDETSKNCGVGSIRDASRLAYNPQGTDNDRA